MSDQQTELRHITSIQNLSPHKHTSISTKLGSRSPASSPSSPTSVHSSSSAIFERDIEPLSSPPPSSSTHRIPRSKASEHLDHSVPSVLDSAAELLTAPSSPNHIAVLAPAQGAVPVLRGASGLASPIGSVRSRSPSPRASLLLSVPSVSPVPTPLVVGGTLGSPRSASTAISEHKSVVASAGSSPRAGPTVSTPSSTYYSLASVSGESSPTTTTLEHPPSLPLTHTSDLGIGAPSSPHRIAAGAPGSGSGSPGYVAVPASPATGTTVSPTSPVTTTMASPANNNAAKRLSFMSYTDLLASTPARAVPLSALTSSAPVAPPPHIPVLGFASASGAVPASGYGSVPAGSPGAGVGGMLGGMEDMPALPASGAPSLRGHTLGLGHVGGAHGHGHVGGLRDSVVLVDDVGGEWEREGLGRGLEERLEALMGEGVGF